MYHLLDKILWKMMVYVTRCARMLGISVPIYTNITFPFTPVPLLMAPYVSHENPTGRKLFDACEGSIFSSVTTVGGESPAASQMYEIL